MDIDTRNELKEAEDGLHLWANRYRGEREKYGRAVERLGIIVASKNIKESLSFENKIVQLLKENNPVIESLWQDYTNGEQNYKAAEILWKTYEHKINNIKFKNRIIM